MSVAAPETERVVYRLIYRSRNRIPDGQRGAELGTLFSQARSHNKRSAITGALLLLDDYFVQTLEGDEAHVQALLGRIRVDPRHDALEVLDTGLVDGRVFARWAMAKVADREDEPDLPLIAHVRGIAPATPRGDATADQEAVLEVMRAAGSTPDPEHRTVPAQRTALRPPGPGRGAVPCVQSCAGPAGSG